MQRDTPDYGRYPRLSKLLGLFRVRPLFGGILYHEKLADPGNNVGSNSVLRIADKCEHSPAPTEDPGSTSVVCKGWIGPWSTGWRLDWGVIQNRHQKLQTNKCSCVRTYRHTFVHTYILRYLHTYISTYILTNTHACMHACIQSSTVQSSTLQ